MWFRRKPRMLRKPHMGVVLCMVPGGRLAQCPRGIEPSPTEYIERFCGSDSRGDNEFKLKNLPLPVRRGEYRKGDVGSPDHCGPSTWTLGHLQAGKEIHAWTEPHGSVRFESRVHTLYVIVLPFRHCPQAKLLEFWHAVSR